MSATAHYIDDTITAPRMAQSMGFAALMRLTYRLLGISLLIAALGLVLVSSEAWGAPMLMMKVGVAFFLALCGVNFLFAARRPRRA